MLASCAVIPAQETPSKVRQARPFSGPARIGPARIGPAYTIGDRAYIPSDDPVDEVGLASWYGEEARGHLTASGEPFDPDAISAAHPTLPLPSYVEVTALDTGRTLLVRINDRGPFHSNRIIDLSLAAARQLALTGGGARMVRVRRVDPSEDDKQALREGQAVPLRSADSATFLNNLRSRGGRVAPTASGMPRGPGPFFVQIASFSSEARADTLAHSLGAEVTLGAGVWRVRTGPFETAEAAQAALALLAARGYPGAIITR